MHYLTRPPGRCLAPFVDRLWTLSDAPEHSRERVLPGGTQELVVNLADDEIRLYDDSSQEATRRYRGAVVSGAYTASFEIDTRAHASIAGVHFKPGGAARILGISAAELENAHVELDDLWGPEARRLREQLCAAPASARFAILERALVARLQTPTRLHPAVPTAVEALGSGQPSVRELARHLGLSHRRFIEVFRTAVGMTPKLFGRVRRFERAVAAARHGQPPEWASIALECGYFDQSHMIRDCVAFSGMSPTELLRRASEKVKDGHVLV